MTTSRGGVSAERAFEEHEHRELYAGIDRIHELACSAARSAAPTVAPAVREVLSWLRGVLAPHVAWEDHSVFPQIDRRAGTHWATRVMTFEHEQLRQMTRRLEVSGERLLRSPSRDLAVEIAGQLFAVEAILRAHLQREEDLLIPLLEDEGLPMLTAR